MYRIKIIEDPTESKLRQAVLMELVRCSWSGLDWGTLEVGRTEKGKPYLRNGSDRQSVQGVHFSISHSGGLWACVVASCPCGLDLQELRQADYGRLAARFFTTAEQQYVETAGLLGFYEIWVRREALAKYTGLGFFGMSEHLPCLVDCEGRPARTVMWEEHPVVFEEVKAPEGYLAVWCHEIGMVAVQSDVEGAEA